MASVKVEEIRSLLGLTENKIIDIFKMWGANVKLDSEVDALYIEKTREAVNDQNVSMNKDINNTQKSDNSISQEQKFSAKMEEHTHKLEVDFDESSTLYIVHGELNKELEKAKKSIDDYQQNILQKKECFERRKMLPVLSTKSVAIELTNALINQGENFKSSFELINTSVLLCAYNIAKMKKISDYIKQMTGAQLISEQDIDDATDFLLEYASKTEGIQSDLNAVSGKFNKLESEFDLVKSEVCDQTENISHRLSKMKAVFEKAQKSILDELEELKVKNCDFKELLDLLSQKCYAQNQQINANIDEIIKKQEQGELKSIEEIASISQHFNDDIELIKKKHVDDVIQLNRKLKFQKRNLVIAYIISGLAICTSVISLFITFLK